MCHTPSDSAFFTGNQVPAFSIQAACIDDATPAATTLSELMDGRAVLAATHNGGGFAADAALRATADSVGSAEWTTLVADVALGPGYEDQRHHCFSVPPELVAAADGSARKWTHLRINMFPDGGIARLRARGAVCVATDAVSKHVQLDLAAEANGGVSLGASNAHYGRAANLIAAGRAAKMDEGWETARNPNRDRILTTDANGVIVLPDSHVDWALCRLGSHGLIQHIEIDTKEFRGNFPESVAVEVGVV
jgi:allantoicase